MDNIVTLEELESMLDVKFPKTFHDIYRTGAMEWLKHSYDWLNEKRNSVKENAESFFYSVGGDCEPVVFPEIQELINHFEEMLEYDEDYRLGKIKINPRYRFIPFAEMGSGDLYCFWYEGDKKEPEVVVYGHDTGDMTLWAKDFDEFLFIQMGSSVVEWENDIDDESIQAHISFLKGEYKEIFMGGDVDKIEEAIECMDELEQLEYLIEI
ncbi:SMI1/KNR4 family protein [Haloimpatiens sp. FM7330]|uniref:SMI1/KNR4 family protein n=1 Tax=Haloimpatiens sp. FM7330 TaxID=3298610 RepID=UPI0036353C87